LRAHPELQMKMPLLSRILFTLVAVFFAAAGHFADMSKTHMFNPNWPPHAKFHAGQTLMFSIALAFCAIYFSFRRTSDKVNSVIAAALFSSLYAITQALAIVYPNTYFWDPEFASMPNTILGVPGQLFIDAVALSVVSFSVWFALRKRAIWVEG
jgi:hypothetical protein